MTNISRARRLFLTATAATFLVAAVAPKDGVAIPDVIYVNGKIYTGKPGVFVQALAVRNGKVLATGTTGEVRGLADASTRVHDLSGKLVLPGFYDNHVHVGLDERRSMAGAGPKLDNVRNLADLQRELRAFAATVPAGTWIRGAVPHGNGEWEPFPEDGLPTRWDIDAATPNHPVALNRGHVMLTNSKALEIAGVKAGSPQPPGGHVDLNDKGEPTGVLRETPARRLVTRHFPAPPPIEDEAGLATLRARLQSQLALGVTSLNIPGMRPGTDLRLMQKLYADEGETLPRATIQLRVSPGFDLYDDVELAKREVIKEIESLSFYTGFGNDRIKIGAIKMSVDGAFSGQAAWLIDSYPGRPDYHGTVRIPPEALYAVARRAHQLGWQLGIHAIGDRAVKETIDVIARVQKELPRRDPRHYIHHISVRPPQASLETMRDAKIIASMQPNFTYTIAPFYKLALSAQKLPHNNPEKSLKDMGIRMSLGSDSLPDGPFVGLYGATTRKGIDGQVYGAGERISLDDAIYNATAGTAYMTFDEDTRGTLEPGKVADMIVLPEDIFQVDREKLRTMRPLETIIAGKTVWKSDGKVAARKATLEELMNIDSCFAEELLAARAAAATAVVRSPRRRNSS